MHKLIQAAVFAAIGVLVFASLLIPVVNEATATTDTFTNDGYYTMDTVGNDADIPIVWNKSAPMTIEIGDKSVDMSNLPAGRSYTLVGGENFVIRFDKISANGVVIQGVGNGNSEYFNAGNGTEITITIQNGDVTCHTNRTDVEGGVTKVYSYTDSIYVINPDNKGDYRYVMKDASRPAYVKGDSTIYFIGVTNVTSTGLVAVYGEGNLDDGMTLETAGYNVVTSVDGYSEPVATYTEVAGYLGLYSLEKFEFTITYNTSSTYDATYSYFIVPATVTAEKAIHADEPTRDILAVMPLVLIIGLILGVVGAAVYTRIE